jgi:hypothetical protein
LRKTVDLSSTTTNRENTSTNISTITPSSTTNDFSVRGAAINRASLSSAISQPAYVQAVAAAERVTDNSRSMISDMPSLSATNNFSIRGAANNRASDLGAATTQMARSQADADLERATGKSRSILSTASPSNSHGFGVRGAANSSTSGLSALSQSIHGPAALGSGRATGGSTSIFSGYGHYSAGGVPAYPGVLGGLGLGTQTRTAGSWTWTAGRM